MTNGIKITQRGLDVEKAADYQMVLNSEVLTPSIALQGDGIIDSDHGFLKIVNHTLGFRPVVLLYLDTISTLVAGDNRWGLDNNFISFVSDTDLFFDTSSVNVYPTRYHYFILNIPVDQDYDAPAGANESAVSNNPSDFGLEISLPGHSVEDRNLENFALDTASKTLQIHAIRWGYGSLDDPDFTGGIHTIRVRHNLGYPPLLLTTLEKFGDPSLVAFGYIQFPARVNATDAVAVLIPDDRRFGMILFKDPLNPKDVQPIGVTYG